MDSRVWGIQDADAARTVKRVKGLMPENFTDCLSDQTRNDLRDNPPDYYGNVESLLEQQAQSVLKHWTRHALSWQELMRKICCRQGILR